MADRLVKIEQLLQQQRSATFIQPDHSPPGTQNGSGASTSTSTAANGHLSASTPATQATSTDFEVQDATTGAHSVVASKIVEQAVEDSPGAHRNFELAGALNALKEMVAKSQQPLTAIDFVETDWAAEAAALVVPPTLAEVDVLVGKAAGMGLELPSSMKNTKSLWFRQYHAQLQPLADRLRAQAEMYQPLRARHRRWCHRTNIRQWHAAESLRGVQWARDEVRSCIRKAVRGSRQVLHHALRAGCQRSQAHLARNTGHSVGVGNGRKLSTPS